MVGDQAFTFCAFGGVSVDIFSCVLDGAFVAVFIVEVISAVRCLWQ